MGMKSVTLAARMRTELAPLARFFAVSVAGVMLDVALATLLVRAGWSLAAAVALSLGITAALLYLVHERWTFAAQTSAFSFKRLGGTLAATGFVYVVRLACLWFTGSVLNFGEALISLQLLFATGLSFVANYLAMRVLVMRR